MKSTVGWNAFPHAYKYLNKYPYSEQVSEALLKWSGRFKKETSWTFSGSIEAESSIGEEHGRFVPSSDLDGKSSPEVYYWETTFRAREVFSYAELGLVGVGVERGGNRIMYCSNGVTPQASLSEGFELGDTIGCGSTHHSSAIFFTKNGRLIAAVDPRRLGRKWTRPCLVTTCYRGAIIQSSVVTITNFGEAPFKFDIERYCDSLTSVFSRFPPEIFQLIVQFHALALGTSSSGIEGVRDIYRLSVVSRHCYQLCHKITCQDISLTSHLEMLAATSFGLLPPTSKIVTSENISKPWLHVFLICSYPKPGLIQHWVCDHNDSDLRFPPHAPMDIHIFARSNDWNNLVTLELRNRRFRSWAQFAKLVYSFLRLEHLTVKKVAWKDALEAPISWIRFSRRLHTLRCLDDETDCMAGYLWLFFAGRPSGSSCGPALLADDISPVALICTAIVGYAPSVRWVEYTRCRDESYILTTRETTILRPIKLTLTRNNEIQHRLSKICVRTAEFVSSPEIQVHTLSYQLSSRPAVDIRTLLPQELVSHVLC